MINIYILKIILRNLIIIYCFKWEIGEINGSLICLFFILERKVLYFLLLMLEMNFILEFCLGLLEILKKNIND